MAAKPIFTDNLDRTLGFQPNRSPAASVLQSTIKPSTDRPVVIYDTTIGESGIVHPVTVVVRYVDGRWLSAADPDIDLTDHITKSAVWSEFPIRDTSARKRDAHKNTS